MSRSRKDGHGRCTWCGDAGACRRHRERAWQKADDLQDSLAPVDERAMYDQGPEQDSLAPVEEQDSLDRRYR